MIDANSKRRGIINKTEYLNFEKSLKNNLELMKTSSVRVVDDWVKQATSVNSF